MIMSADDDGVTLRVDYGRALTGQQQGAAAIDPALYEYLMGEREALIVRLRRLEMLLGLPWDKRALKPARPR